MSRALETDGRVKRLSSRRCWIFRLSDRARRPPPRADRHARPPGRSSAAAESHVRHVGVGLTRIVRLSCPAQVQSSFDHAMRKAALLYNPDSGGSKQRQRELESALAVLRAGGVEADLVPYGLPRSRGRGNPPRQSTPVATRSSPAAATERFITLRRFWRTRPSRWPFCPWERPTPWRTTSASP